MFRLFTFMPRTDIISRICYDNVHIIEYNKVKNHDVFNFKSLILSIPSFVLKLGSTFSVYHQRRASKIVIHHPLRQQGSTHHLFIILT